MNGLNLMKSDEPCLLILSFMGKMY